MKWRFRFQKFLPWLSVVFLVALVIGPIGLLIWLLFFTNTFSIKAVTVIDAREYTQAATKIIAEEELKKVAFDRSIFFIAGDIIANRISGELPQVRTVQVRRQLPGTLRIVIQEKEPALLLFSNGDYYLIDDQGIPYEEARLENLPGILLPTIKNSDAAGQVEIGVAAVSPSFVKFVQEIYETLPSNLEAEVVEIRMPSLAAREVHFHLSNNWQVRFDVTRTATNQLRVLSRVVQESIPEKILPRIDYIDLRIPDRVYYRTVDSVTAVK